MVYVEAHVADLKATSADVDKFRSTIATLMEDLESDLARVVWDGSDQAAYLAEKTKIASAINNLQLTLRSVSELINEVALGYDDLKTYGMKLFNG